MFIAFRFNGNLVYSLAPSATRRTDTRKPALGRSVCVCVCAVSYTHLDVYKRQGERRAEEAILLAHFNGYN